MEKLQAAIEKAREQRQNGKPARSRQSPAPARTPTGPLEQRWSALEAFHIAPATARQNRLVSALGGKDAGPFDMLRTRILQQAAQHGWKRVALVSPHSGCGKTTTAANLVFSFGRQADLNTIVLDLDFRRQGLAAVLAHQPQKNMGDVLKGDLDFADHGLRHGDNVAIGLNSGVIQHASEILQSQRAKQVLDDIQHVYEPDIMLFDMPPLMGADDNFGFLGNVDCALLVAAAERTTTEQLDIAERQLSELTNVMGIVLNKSHFTDGVYGYGYGYE